MFAARAVIAPSSGAGMATDAVIAEAEGDDGVLAVAVRLFDPAPDGLGFVLPLIVLGTLVIAVAFVLRRQTRKPGAVS